MLFMQMNCYKDGCDSTPNDPGYFVYDYEIENLDYKGHEKINFIHFLNGVLEDTLYFNGSGGVRMDSIRRIKNDESAGCAQFLFYDQTYVLKYSRNLDTMKIILYGGQAFEKITSRTTFNVEFKNKKFSELLAYISNINAKNYHDSISLYGNKFFNVNLIQSGKDTISYLLYGYKTGINFIKIENETFQSF